MLLWTWQTTIWLLFQICMGWNAMKRIIQPLFNCMFKSTFFHHFYLCQAVEINQCFMCTEKQKNSKKPWDTAFLSNSWKIILISLSHAFPSPPDFIFIFNYLLKCKYTDVPHSCNKLSTSKLICYGLIELAFTLMLFTTRKGSVESLAKS